MSKNENFVLTLIKKTLNRELTWLHADHYFAMPESSNPSLSMTLKYFNLLDNSGKCYYCEHNRIHVFIFFLGESINLFLQTSTDTRVMQIRDVDRATLYRLYNAIRASEEPDDMRLQKAIDDFLH